MNKYQIRQTPLALAISSALAGGPAHAAIITVTTNADGPLGSITGECTLRAAVAAANTGAAVDGCPSGSSGIDEISFAPELAASTITLADGQIEIQSHLKITGPIPEDHSGVTLGSDQVSRIFHIQSAHVELRGMTLTEGRATGSGGFGGALYAIYSDVILRDTRITDNVADNGGGGLAIIASDVALYSSEISDNSVAGSHSGFGAGLFVGSKGGGEVLLRDSVISGNTAQGGVASGGGGLHAIGYFDVALHNSKVLGNSASGERAYGGGINVEFGRITVHDSEISGNAVHGDNTGGGGVAVRFSSGLENSISTSLVSDNHSQYGPGGGILVSDAGITLLRSTVAGNSTEGDPGAGGGLYVTGGDATVLSSTVSGNSTTGKSAYGGGVTVKYGDAIIVNSTLSGNTAPHAPGGGLHVFSNTGNAGGYATLMHSTLAYNVGSGSGDGIFAIYDLRLYNSLIVQAGEDERGCNAPAAGHANSQISDDSCTGTATAASVIDLQPLADNGGPTRTHALGTGSTAIEAAGDCVGDFAINRDQRGLPRPGAHSSACDIGAFEVGEDRIFTDRFEN